MPMPVCTYLEDARTCYEEVSETCYKLRWAFFGKSVLCPCGDGPGTAFHRYFRVSFGWLCLQELVCVDYVPEGPGVSWLYQSAAGALSMRETKLPCHGSIFDSWCQSFFDACDVVATMPPDSIFAECLTEIVDRGKDFLLFGHISHKEDPIAKRLGSEGRLKILPSLDKRGKILLPENGDLPEKDWWRDETGQLRAALPELVWYTSLDVPGRR